MLLLVMGVGFENTWTGSKKLNVSRVIPRLYGWVYKTKCSGYDREFSIKTIPD